MIRSVSIFFVLLILSGCLTYAISLQDNQNLMIPRTTQGVEPTKESYYGLCDDCLDVFDLYTHYDFKHTWRTNSTWFMVINEPGYYCIDTNVTLNCNGIYVNASNVIIDGKGHSISKGDPIKNFVGIHIADAENVTVMNIVLDWINGEAMHISNSTGIHIKNASMSSSCTVYVNSSRGILISNSSFFWCYMLIIESSENVTLENNYIYKTSASIENSLNIKLIGNNISQEDVRGYPCVVVLYNSSRILVCNNSFHIVSLIVFNSWNNTIVDNYANGRRIVYLENESGQLVTGDLGELILVGCDNISVESVSVSNMTLAIDIFRSTNVRLRNLRLSENRLGIWIDESEKVDIYKSEFQDLSIIHIQASTGVNIACNFFGFGAHGIFIKNSAEVSINKNIFQFGEISLLGSHNNSISSNILNRVRVDLSNSYNNYMYDNIFQGYGLGIGDSFSNYVFNNTITNSSYGIVLKNASGNFIFFNNFINNSGDIVIRWDSSNRWVSPKALPFRYGAETRMGFLGNYWDRYNGTDRDGDGIGDEPYLNDTAPLISPTWNYVIADSDGDGVNDLKEIAFGTNPFVPNNEHEEVSHGVPIGAAVLIVLILLTVILVIKKHKKLQHR